jgi:hypothetical protein
MNAIAAISSTTQLAALDKQKDVQFKAYSKRQHDLYKQASEKQQKKVEAALKQADKEKDDWKKRAYEASSVAKAAQKSLEQKSSLSDSTGLSSALGHAWSSVTSLGSGFSSEFGNPFATGALDIGRVLTDSGVVFLALAILIYFL